MPKIIQVTFQAIDPVFVKTYTQRELNLSDEEMGDSEWLKEYISDYHTPDGYFAINISII